MANQFIESHIKRLLLFESLPDDQLTTVSGAFQVLRFEPGALVFRQGQPAQGLFYFASGRGVLTRFEQDPNGGAPTEVVVGEVTTNEYVGESALFAQTLETTSLRIVESSIVLFLSRERLAAVLLAHPELRTNLGLQRGDQHKVVKPLFKGQRTDEVTLQIFRRHWWSFVRFSWIPLGLATIMVFGALMMSDSMALALVMIGMALLIPAGLMYLFYMEWQDDAIIVTDQRVVRVKNVLFGIINSLSEIPLDHVHEVSIVVPPGDPFARIFKYATVTVRTAGDVGTVSLGFIARAQHMRDLIFTHRDRVRRSVQQQQRREIEAEIEKLLGMNTQSAPVGTPTPYNTGGAKETEGGFQFGLLKTRFIDGKGHTVYRKHWLIWISHILPPLVAMILGGGLSIFTLFRPIPGMEGLGFLIGLFILAISLIWFYIADWDWRNDLFILGDDIITLIHRRPLWLQNEVDQVRLNKIDSVVSSKEGLLNNLFDMGDVRISLIGSDQAKILGHVPNPASLQAEISRLLNEMRQQEQRGESQRQREAITEYLTAYHEKLMSSAAASAPASTSGQQPAARPVSGDTMAREVSPQPPQPEPPPQPIRDAVRPPRVPRVRPDNEQR